MFASALSAQGETGVTRATLDNGMRVVIIRDPLAPVVTVENNYLAGGNDTPAGFPGMAHAQEHMTFRGCEGVTADQIAAMIVRSRWLAAARAAGPRPRHTYGD